ncbi:10238_t:CDS:2 [Funneliformis geosporum]|nr:10238_t:CDS:2 [Funneliformis geosporum]
MELESLVKYPDCSLNGKKKCVSKVPFQNIVKIDIIGKKQHQKVTLKNSPYSSLIHPTSDNSDNCRMGIGWICLNQQQSFRASVTNWVSSTRAEIFALLTALIIFSKHFKVTLYTDSMATIHSFSSYISNNNLSVQIFEKVSIKYIVNQSNLNVTLIKVKRHSGDIYNNIANDLAKSGTQSPEISINYLKVSTIMCLFQCNDIIIKSSVRRFTKDIFAVTAVLNIIDLHRNNDLKSLTRQANVYWMTIWSIFTLD